MHGGREPTPAQPPAVQCVAGAPRPTFRVDWMAAPGSRARRTRATRERLTARLTVDAPRLAARPVWAYVFAAALCLLIAVATAVAAVTSRAADWRAWQLVVLLAALASLGNRTTVRIGEQRVSGAFVPIALAMILLGPAPAAAVGGACDSIGAIGLGWPPLGRLANVLNSVVFSLAGGLLARALLGDLHAHHDARTLVVVTLVVFLSTTALNFLLTTAHLRITRRAPFLRQVRREYLGMWPAVLSAAILTALLTTAYARFGFPVVLGVATVTFLFTYVWRALVRSQERIDLLVSHEHERARVGAQIRVRERERWARELQEDTARELSLLRQTLLSARAGGHEALDRLAREVLQTLSMQIGGLRHLITELSPPALDTFGLAVALGDLQDSARARDGLFIRVDVDPQLEFPLAQATERSIYRIVEEASARRAGRGDGGPMVVSLRRHRDGLHVGIHSNDDGHGTRLRAGSDPAGDGLVTMRERAEGIGAHLSVWDDAAGVELVVPWRRVYPIAGTGARRRIRRAHPRTWTRPRVSAFAAAALVAAVAALYATSVLATAIVAAVSAVPFVVLGWIFIASERRGRLIAQAAHATLCHGLAEAERERARWARDLHDETIQSLGALRLRLASALEQHDPADLEQAADEVSVGLDGARESLDAVIADLRPPRVAELGLVAALETLAPQPPHGGVRVAVHAPRGDVALPGEIETTVFRLAQEALTNAKKHARATAIDITLTIDHDLRLTVTDDGCGFVAHSRHRGHGMRSMEARTTLHGGRLAVESAPGTGTTVDVVLPLTRRRRPTPWLVFRRLMRLHRRGDASAPSQPAGEPSLAPAAGQPG